LITSKALAKVEELVGDALAKGAKALAGAARHPLGGTFYEPTVLVDVPEDARLLREEIFGPVAISTTEAPFPGVKQSGIGREGSHYGIE
jgi:succinate-semialdehyde dehydrogenase / glutarate-semialdehyde dehydrogenase